MIPVLKISSYAGYSIGAEHYYGKITGYLGGKYTVFEMTHPLTAREADYLNKKDGRGSFHEEGEISSRYESRIEVEQQAIETYKNLFPGALALLEGDFAVRSVQLMLDGPPEVMEKINKLYNEFEKIGGYERSPKRATKIDDKFSALIKTLSVP